MIASVLLVILVYNFAIKKTILARTDSNNAEKQLQIAANAPAMAVQLEKELMQMDTKIGADVRKGNNSGEELLDLLTNYCQSNNAVLREFPQTTLTEQDKLTIETNLFIIEGDFSSLIKLVYTLEQKIKLGKVASVRYQLKKDPKSKKMALTARVYLQNVKKKENEK